MFLRLEQGDDEERSMHKIEAAKKELYRKIKSQVADRLGLQDQEIKKAEKTFCRFFSRDWKRSSESLLQKKIESADLIFFGDFHGVRQFQNNLLRWLKRQNLADKPVILALECLPSRHQKWIDLYLAGGISEQDFLIKTQWDRVWGFPWEHYKPLFDWARDKKQKIKVINGPTLRSATKQRERWGVGLLLKIQKENPGSRIFVLYGEYHLLAKGFPALLKSKTSFKPLFVFQNSESLYFQKPPRKQNAEGQIFQSSPFYFCLQNVSPWVKWQNYNLFLEASLDSDLDEDFDFTEHVVGVSQILSQTLKIPLNPNHYAVFTNADRALWDHLKKIPEEEFRFFETLIEQNLSFVHLLGGWAFLGRISANETAHLAMQTLLFQFNPALAGQMKSKNHWEFLIWIQAFSYLGSKLINAHRKSPTLQELQKKSRLLSGRPVERQAARFAVNYTLHQSLGSENAFDSLGLSHSVRFQAVKWISNLLGEKLYNAYNQGGLNLETLKNFMRKNPEDKNFHVVMQSLYEMVDGF